MWQHIVSSRGGRYEADPLHDVSSYGGEGSLNVLVSSPPST